MVHPYRDSFRCLGHQVILNQPRSHLLFRTLVLDYSSNLMITLWLLIRRDIGEQLTSSCNDSYSWAEREDRKCDFLSLWVHQEVTAWPFGLSLNQELSQKRHRLAYFDPLYSPLSLLVAF